MLTRKINVIGLMIGLSLGVAGCGSSSDEEEEGVNDCTPAKAKATNTVTFPGSGGFSYDPKCVKIAAGDSVTFNGDFAAHPLQGGTASDSTKTSTPDPNSPIKETKTGMTASFTFPTAGSFGFFCENHFASDMYGAVIVE